MQLQTTSGLRHHECAILNPSNRTGGSKSPYIPPLEGSIMPLSPLLAIFSFCAVSSAHSPRSTLLQRSRRRATRRLPCRCQNPITGMRPRVQPVCSVLNRNGSTLLFCIPGSDLETNCCRHVRTSAAIIQTGVNGEIRELPGTVIVCFVIGSSLTFRGDKHRFPIHL